MASWHGYLGVENLALNATQRATLVAALRALGPEEYRSPACLCHWRTRLNGEAAIFGVAVGSIDDAGSSVSFADGNMPVVMFSHAGTDYLRLALFGGLGVEWNESGDEARGYLAANSAEWEEVIGV